MNSTLAFVFFLIFLIIAVGSFAYLIYRNVIYLKSPVHLDSKKFYKIISYLGLIFIISFGSLFLFIHPWHNHPTTVGDWVWTVFGSYLLGASIFAFTETFILHYYGKLEDKKLDKKLFAICMISIVAMMVFFFFLTNGFADYINLYAPLAKSIDFTKGLVYPGQSGGHIAFYALCILGGAVFVYFLADHKLYLQYGRHGLLESTFLVAFPAGIIGARVAYVIGNFEKEFAGQPWYKVFAIWEGGLTILGGAIAGLVVGVLWYRWRNKGFNVWVAVDICAPVILIAQAMGRWGNFFNCEVYGGLVPEEYWTWLPKIIFNNMHFNNSGTMVATGYIQAPLFFIEGIANIIGYAVLAHLFNNRLKNYCELGDVSFGYLIWYGFTRVFMEPLRDPAYNMGNDGYWSWFWSIMFIAAGIILIAGNHLIRYLLRKKKNLLPSIVSYEGNIIGSISIVVVASALTIVGAILMASNSYSKTIQLNAFNIGTICLVVGISCYFLLLITIPKLILAHKRRTQNETL